jgi:hypothetical protein
MPLQMQWRDLLKPEIQDFIKTHHESDVRSLALKKVPDASWPYALILDQIKVRQKAKIKSPDLYETDGFIFPKSDLFEQASSAACANYKTSILEKGSRLVDLTAGCGCDGFVLSGSFDKTTLVERDAYSAALLAHNAQRVGGHINVVCDDALAYVQAMDSVDVVFIDPQRRENGRKGFFAFEDCSPNIVDLLPLLREKTKKLVIKASPLLDIEKGIHALGCVSQVHVVQWQRECKEVLFVLDFSCPVEPDTVQVVAVELNDDGIVKKCFSYFMCDEKNAPIECAMPEQYIYEADPAFQKAGGFKSMAYHFGLKKLHPSTQLYTAQHLVSDFPGRALKIIDIVSADRKALKIKKADLKVRNFPSTVQDLRKKLSLKDGGYHRIYATKLCDNTRKLIICEK